MPLNNPSNANNLNFTPGGTIASDKVQAAILEAAAEALQKANNLSDLASVSDAWNNLGAAQSLAANGWTKLPNGLILQWQTISIPSQLFNAGITYQFANLFPISFNSCYLVIGSQSAGIIANGPRLTATNSQSFVAFNYTSQTTSSVSFMVFSIGI